MDQSAQRLLEAAAAADQEALDGFAVAVGLHRQLVAQQEAGCNTHTHTEKNTLYSRSSTRVDRETEI